MRGTIDSLLTSPGTAGLGAVEALEPRLVLSAPTASLLSVSVGKVDMTVTVRYAAATGIDVTSINGNDVRVASAAKSVGGVSLASFSELGRLAGTTVQADGSVVAKYVVTARGGAWDWADSGLYTVSLASMQVRSKSGQWNAAATLKSQSLSFAGPRADLVSATLGNMSQWLIGIRYTDDIGIDRASIGLGDLQVQSAGALVSLGRPAYTTGSGATITAYYYAKTAQNAASWMDRGSYTIVLRGGQVFDTSGNSLPSYVMGTQSYTSDRPAAQLASSTFTADAWTVCIRYRAELGVDLGSIGHGDLQYSGAKGTVLASLVESPIVGADGSVLATYRFAAPEGGWVSTPGAYTLSMRASQVFESVVRPGQSAKLSVLSGYFVNGAYTATGPAESAVSGTAAEVVSAAKTSSKTLEFTVRFSDADGLNDASLTGGQTLMMYGPKLSSGGAGGGAFKSALAVVSASQESPTSWMVTYRLNSATTLPTGVYYLRTNSFQVMDAIGNIMPSVELLAMSV
ncbi:MAG TPA: hypothetical protein VD997_08720 [Phycisphaerales bacterium]|nr:hypothetical protein [Phycisphaerales bacterium]